MQESVAERYGALLDAVAFAARAHQGQLRKDGITPYVSHVFRVCLVLRDIFGIDDPSALMAALLHDTIEDTRTDYDELAKRFDTDVAHWVALLSKDKRQEETAREKAYIEQLVAAPWQVQACKLADIFDNLLDSQHFSAEQQAKSVRRAQEYLTALRGKVAPELERPYALVSQLVAELK